MKERSPLLQLQGMTLLPRMKKKTIIFCFFCVKACKLPWSVSFFNSTVYYKPGIPFVAIITLNSR
jgi:hypothetical protein